MHHDFFYWLQTALNKRRIEETDEVYEVVKSDQNNGGLYQTIKTRTIKTKVTKTN